MSPETLQLAAEVYIRLCLCSRWHAPAFEAARVLASTPGWDWDAVAAQVSGASLGPLLYSAAGGRGLLPAELERTLQAMHLANAARNLSMRAELERALAALAAAGIPAILLKGAALIAGVYEDPAARFMTDLDLLVREQHLSQVLPLLAQAGFEPNEVRPGVMQAEASEIVLRKPGPIETDIDLHWRLLYWQYYQERAGGEWFWQTARPALIGGVPALVLGPEALLMMLATHVQRHAGRDLRWWHDIAAALVFYREDIDWQLLVEKARTFGLLRPLREVLPRVAAEWHAPVPAPALAALQSLPVAEEEEQIFVAHAEERGHGPLLSTWDALKRVRGNRLRLWYILAYLFPTPGYMRRRHAAGRLPLALRYPYRWWLGLQSMLGKGQPPRMRG